MISLQEIQPLLADYFKSKPELRAYVFGSVARGEADDKSDIDMLVELDYENNAASFDNWCRMQDDLVDLFGKKVDLVSNNGLSGFVRPYIEKDKKLVYGQA